MHNICLIQPMTFKMLLSLCSLFLLAGCAEIKDPEFRRIENFRLKNLGLQDATVGFSVTYFNPNNFGVAVKEATADVYLDTIYLGKFAQDSIISVEKNAEFSLPLSGNVALQKVLKLNLQEWSQKEVLLRAEGNVKVGKAGIFVNRAIKYQGKHRLEDIDLGQ
jgi:LEA14-like dessication related protein